jgi:hypothetical protein
MRIFNEVTMDAVAEVSTPVETLAPAPEQSTDRRDAVVPEGEATVTPPNGEDHAAKEKEVLQKGVQKRIDRAVRDKYEAQARAKMLEERLAALEQRPAAQPQALTSAPGEPTIDQYDNFDKYVAAKAKFLAKQEIEQTLNERDKRTAAEREQTARATTAGEWQRRVEKATAEMPDFEDVVASSEVPMTEPMRSAIMESDAGPKLAYYLANNPDEAADIARMTPIRAISALGRIEERLSKPVAKQVTSAPAPLTPVGGSAKVAKDPGEMSQAEFERWRKSVIKAR